MQELEKIDAIRKRFPVTYTEAGRLLMECDGDVLQALDRLERQKRLKHQQMNGHMEDLLEEYARKY